MALDIALLEPLHSSGKVKLNQYRNYIPCLKVMMKNKHEADVVTKTSLIGFLWNGAAECCGSA